MPTFNDFLASGDGNLNRQQAELMLADLCQYGVTIRTRDDLWQFRDEHRDLFVTLTEEDKRNGLQSLGMWWERFMLWKRRLNPPPGWPIRPMARARNALTRTR